MKKLLSILLSASVLFGCAAPAYAATSGNPVIKGSFADPDIDYFDCKYWIFPTTDGNPGWSGTQFHVFSSEDLVNWTDEGVILDVADKTPGKNIKGVQIADSKWSEGNAWAPSIEKIGDKYYFLYCGRIRADLLDKYAVSFVDYRGETVYNDKAIGIAVADSPAGPYKALDEPLIYPSQIRDIKGTDDIGQMIDPSVFVDDDASAYVFFGNGIAYGVKLSKDLMSIQPDTLVHYGVWEFRESLVVFKRAGKYYFTWSDFGTDEVKYCVKYATTTHLGPQELKPKATILQMDASNGIYGTGHQSILYQPLTDEYYIAYGRHQTNNGVSVNDPGNFREVCIDKISFSIRGEIPPIKPTNTGVAPVSSHNYTSEVIAPTCTAQGYTLNTCSICKKITKTNFVAKKAHTFVEKSRVNATYAKAGTISYKCKYCPETSTKSIAKLTVAKPASISIFAKSKSFVLKWKKNTKATGYQIQYSTDKNFKKSVKTVKIKKNSTTSQTVKKLSAKKKYYVRIRAYKTYNKKDYYSSWTTKTVTTKK